MPIKSRLDIFGGACDKIKDIELRIITKKFCEYLYFNTYEFKNKSENTNEIKKLTEIIKNKRIEELDWKYIIYIINKYYGLRSLFVRFYDFIINNNIYSSNDKEDIYEFRWIFESYRNAEWLNKIFYHGSNIKFFYIIESKYYNKEIRKKLINFNTNNIFIKNLLKEYIHTISIRSVYTEGIYNFIYYFNYSIRRFNINNIFDFNYEIFKYQYRFYRKYRDKYRNNKKIISFLISFYIFLCQEIKKTGNDINVFKIGDRIDEFCLYRKDFEELYNSGYCLVLYNKFDEIPKIDRWLLMPNNNIYNTTRLNNYKYRALDFKNIDNLEERHFVKKWIWEYDISLSTKYSIYCHIKEFIMIKEKFKNKILDIFNGYDNTQYVTQFEIRNYMEIINNGKSDALFNNKINAIRQYLKFLNNNCNLNIGEHTIRILGYKYLEIEPNPINKNDLEKIKEAFKNNSQGLDRKLYEIIFKLLLITPLRPSEIVSLKVDCIKKHISKGKFTLEFISSGEMEIYKARTITKTSKGEMLSINIGEYAKGLIDEAIELTEHIRSKCYYEEMSNYIFLTERERKRIMIIQQKQFSDYFREILKSINLKNAYRSYNLRHTFMTNAIKVVEEEGGSIFKSQAITLHKNIQTTAKYYYKYDNQKYLEGAYGVTLEDIEIKGKVLKDNEIDSNKFNKKNRVNNSGYCSSNSCIGVECFICSNFITSIKEKDNFISMIQQLENDIISETDDHDLEKKVIMKKLYVKYLEAILSKSNEVNN